MSEQMSKGDVVYTTEGNAVEFVASIDGKFVVRPIYDHDGEEFRDDPIMVNAVFANAPAERLDIRVKQLGAEIEALEQRKRDLAAELRSSQESDKSRIARLAMNAALSRIDDFVSGRITHFVFNRYSDIKVMSVEEAIRYKENDYDRIPKGFRLLTLFGQTNGDLSWRIHHYSDGSGSLEEVMPFCSHADAIAEATRRIEAKYAEWREKPTENIHWIDSAAKSAAAIGVEIPQDILTAIKAFKIKNLVKSRDEKQAELQKIVNDLAVLSWQVPHVV